MGQVARKDAAADDIFADVKTSNASAAAKGGAWKARADETIGPFALVIDAVEARCKQNAEELVPLEAAVAVMDERADDFVGEKSDLIWNKIGRPQRDPGFTIVFPGGIGAYTDGPDEEQPDRMRLMAELLEAGVISRLDPTIAKDIATETRALADAYEAALAPARLPRAKRRMLDRVRGALARAGQIELARLKRLYKADGFSEAEIHTVIPDRPSAKAPAKPKEPEPPKPV